MSYNGSGTFVINSTGQPVVTGTVISSSTFNSLTADLGTGLSTAITKDGQTTTTAKIPFALGISAAAASNFAAGTVAAPSIYLSTDTGTGFYRIGANNTGFAISGTKLLDFSSALLAVTGAGTFSSTLGVTGTSTLAAVNASGLLTVNTNGGTLPAVVGTESLRTAGANGSTNRMLLDGFGGVSSITFRRANTSSAAPSAVQSGDNLAFLSVLGYGATAYNGNISAALFSSAAENWTDTAIGSKWTIQATAIGTTTRSTIAEFSSGATALTGTLGVTSTAAATYTQTLTNSNATGNYGIKFFSTADNNGADAQIFDTACNTNRRFAVDSNGGVRNYSANNVNISDKREKTNFAPAKSYLDVINAIPVQTFNYIDQNIKDDPGLTLGVVAQDVEAVAPELVMESNWGTMDDPKMRLSIYQTDLQYALMKAIQELSAKVATLEAR